VTLFTSILSSQLYHRLSSSLSLISRSVSVIYIITANAKTHIKPTPQQPKPRPLSITSGQPNPTQPTTASLPVPQSPPRPAGPPPFPAPSSRHRRRRNFVQEEARTRPRSDGQQQPPAAYHQGARPICWPGADLSLASDPIPCALACFV
jgi:hypothetical protein